MMDRGFLSACLTGVSIFLTSCGDAMNKTEFDWYATESAPEHYPMEIRRGTFYYKEQDHGLYIPSGGTLNAGWGQMISSHVTGSDKKPLPDRLEVTFFSYTEKLFYHGKFDLPYDEILSEFRQAYKEEPNDPYYNGIMVGIAPGGAVSVWLKGYRRKEVFFGQADKMDLDPFESFGLPFKSREESDAYLAKQLVNVLEPEELESLEKNGVPFGTWARYRNLYRWIPAYKEGKMPTKNEINVHYLNGELSRIPTTFTEEMANTPRPLPRELKFSVDMGKKRILYIIRFDEFELMDAFEKLGANGEKVTIEFDAQLPRHLMKIRVHNDKESIDLVKTYIKE